MRQPLLQCKQRRRQWRRIRKRHIPPHAVRTRAQPRHLPQSPSPNRRNFIRKLRRLRDFIRKHRRHRRRHHLRQMTHPRTNPVMPRSLQIHRAAPKPSHPPAPLRLKSNTPPSTGREQPHRAIEASPLPPARRPRTPCPPSDDPAEYAPPLVPESCNASFAQLQLRTAHIRDQLMRTQQRCQPLHPVHDRQYRHGQHHHIAWRKRHQSRPAEKSRRSAAPPHPPPRHGPAQRSRR